MMSRSSNLAVVRDAIRKTSLDEEGRSILAATKSHRSVSSWLRRNGAASQEPRTMPRSAPVSPSLPGSGSHAARTSPTVWLYSTMARSRSASPQQRTRADHRTGSIQQRWRSASMDSGLGDNTVGPGHHRQLAQCRAHTEVEDVHAGRAWNADVELDHQSRATGSSEVEPARNRRARKPVRQHEIATSLVVRE